MPRTNYRKVYQRTSIDSENNLSRTCRICKESKPIEEFYPNKRYSMGYTHECRECVSAYYKNRNTPEKNQRDFLKRKYNFTVEEYENMVKLQEGKCEICKNVFEKLHIDHDHKTEEVRGLLCNDCNVGIGFLKDNIEFLESAIIYLKKYSQ